MAFDGSKEAIERTKRERARISGASSSSIKTGPSAWAAQQLAQREAWERNYVAPRKKTPAQLEQEFFQMIEQMTASELAERQRGL